MAKQTIITLSGKARHGKDTSAQIIKSILERRGKRVMVTNYADFLKYLAKQYLDWDGSKDGQGRTLLQHLGTEKVRLRFPDYWVETVMGIAKVFEDDYDCVLIADTRFPNEINCWKEDGYSVISVYVERLNFDNGLTEEQKNHPSENALNDFQFDIKIQTRTLEELEQRITLHMGELII